ncbi:MAG: purine-binding chemotaxis protein CheW [Deltaproteobacteria bacterium]|nr:purine-binding chemotaxis protein CheW [Deltaproteobacteria bacterium]
MSDSVQPALVSTGPRQETLTFELAGDVYGVPLRRVREILRPPPVTEVPRSPPGIVGVVSVRGRITTVVDPRRKLGLITGGATPRSRILLVEGHGEIVGLWVDAVLKVHRLAEREIELASVLGGAVAEHIRGIGRPARERNEAPQVIILLDLDALLPR